jgi:hypothetical protein
MSAAESSARASLPSKPRAVSPSSNSVMAALAGIQPGLATAVAAGTENQTALPPTCQPASRALVGW